MLNPNRGTMGVNNPFNRDIRKLAAYEKRTFISLLPLSNAPLLLLELYNVTEKGS